MNAATADEITPRYMKRRPTLKLEPLTCVTSSLLGETKGSTKLFPPINAIFPVEIIIAPISAKTAPRAANPATTCHIFFIVFPLLKVK